MRILILGGDGMLGHQFLRSWQDAHEVKVTLRNELACYAQHDLFTQGNSYPNVTVECLASIERALADFSPDAVINAIGVTKQRTDADGIMQTIQINALFPHQLAKICKQQGARLVTMSTDCVFSGREGFYPESAASDAEDIYGRSKYLGEVNEPHVLTLRKSTIGLELGGHHGLIEWFLAQKGEIKGFRQAIYSGLISAELARAVEFILLKHPTLSGVWNVASQAINKYDLLYALAERLGRKDIQLIPNDDFVCDRSLDSSRFAAETGYIVPSWDEMLDELAAQIAGKKYDFT